MRNSERDPRTYAIIGAAMEVHNEMGRGFLEPVYQCAFEAEMRLRELPFEREKPVPVYYKGIQLACGYRIDFLCYGSVIVEAKALPALTSREESQLLNYLKATRLHVGLLINFGTDSLEWKRMVWGKEDPH